MTAAALAVIAVLAQGRDAAAAPAGTGAIVGTITTDETPARPLRRVIVTLNAPDLPRGRANAAITDDAGRFAFTGLAPGRYTLNASKRGWVTMPYGARSAATRAGRAIPLAAGERATVSIALPRGAVITGTILDPTGGPPNNATVRVLRYSYQANTGERRLTPAPMSMPTGIDEQGRYRIYGLAPGDYYIEVVGTGSVNAGTELRLTTDVDVQEAAKAIDSGPSAPSADVPARNVTYAPTFYPGTASPAQASPITLHAGEERDGVDMTLQYTPASRVEGTVTGPGGGPAPSGTQVNLVTNDPSMVFTGFDGFRIARTSSDGRFEFGQVQPGAYLLVARAAVTPEGGTAPQMYSASMDLDVQGNDLQGLSLALADTLTVSGRIQFDGTGAPPPMTGIRVALTPAVATGVTVTGGSAIVNADGTFTLSGVTPGRYRLSSSMATPVIPWTVRSATIAGQDALDGAVDIRQSLADAVVTVTDRIGELNGRVEAAGGTDYTLILFPQNHAWWGERSRHIMTTRTAKDGSFTIPRVPPGDYALAAVEDVEPGEWADPAFLQRIEPTAIKVTIAEGEKKTQNIRIGGGG